MGKEKFLKDEFWKMAVNGALCRSNTYSSENEKKREKLRNSIKTLIDEIIKEQYKKNAQNVQTPIENIERIVKFSKYYKEILKGNSLKFGVAAKLLNLYLKYLWCANFIKEPDHCPIDSNVLKRIGMSDKTWTSPEFNKDIYIKAMKEIAEEARKEKMTVAQWELKLFNEYNNKS